MHLGVAVQREDGVEVGVVRHFRKEAVILRVVSVGTRTVQHPLKIRHHLKIAVLAAEIFDLHRPQLHRIFAIRQRNLNNGTDIV